MLKAWLVRNVPHLIELAALPFDSVTHERYFATIGWPVTREKWRPENCLKVHFNDIDCGLVAVYKESETCIAIGLFALTGEPTTYDFAIASRIEFDKAFDEILAGIMPLLPTTPAKGAYQSQFDDRAYNYVYWGFAQAFITLVQHYEGDGNYGHDANLDLCIVPRLGTDYLVCPLETNILF